MDFTGSQWVAEPQVSCDALAGLYKGLAPRKAWSFVLSSVCSPIPHRLMSTSDIFHPAIYTLSPASPPIVLVFV